MSKIDVQIKYDTDVYELNIDSGTLTLKPK